MKEDDKGECIENEYCPICYQPSDERLVTLKCGHKFHYQCILETYKNNIKNKYSGKWYNKVRECPYCRTDGGYLELEKRCIPVEYIHKEYKEFITKVNNGDISMIKKYLNPVKCCMILSKGKNKGLQCSKKKSDGDYCKIHSAYIKNQIE